MPVTDNPSHDIQYVTMNGRLNQTFEIIPIPRKVSDTDRHSAGLVQKTIPTLLPFTRTTNSRTSDIVIGVPELLQQYMSNLVSLEVVHRPPPKVVPKPQQRF